MEAAHEWVPNYASLKDHTDSVREKFEEDVREGLMERMTLGERRYGERRAIAERLPFVLLLPWGAGVTSERPNMPLAAAGVS